MDIGSLLADKLVKPKEKTEHLCKLVQDGSVSVKELVEFAKKAKDPAKATCIEVMEYASKLDPSIVNKETFSFVVDSLKEKAPRIKWESAKVIGNSAQLHSKNLDKAIVHLLENTEHEGTVVRWSAAFALGEIIKLKTTHNKDLIPAAEAICSREEKGSIRKFYEAAMKKVK